MIFLVNDRKEFYKKIAENSLKDIKTRRTTRTTKNSTYNHMTKNNNYKKTKNITKNGMIKFDEEPNQTIKSKFFIQCIICVLIVCIFYYLSNSNSEKAINIVDKTKILLDSKFNIDDKISNILSKFKIETNVGGGSNGNVSVDDKLIEQMEEEIENTPKK